jgi:hypothetical protein
VIKERKIRRKGEKGVKEGTDKDSERKG